jgi:hypothetical protein
MAWDPMSERVLLLAYPEGSEQDYLQMWAWDGTDWTELIPETTEVARPENGPPGTIHLVPMPASGHVMAWFRHNNTGKGQTWLWDGNDWILKHTGYSGAQSTPFVYDPETGELRRIVCSAHSMKWYDQFEWTGTNWQAVEQDCTNWNDYLPMTWDPTTGDLYGVTKDYEDCKSGTYRPLARWEGEKWVRIEDCVGPAGQSPTGTITYDEARSQLMISTDADQSNHGYVWDGCWEPGGFFLQDPKRSGHAIGYDLSSLLVMLTGGTAPPYTCCKHTYYKGDEGQKKVYNTALPGSKHLRMVYADHLNTLLGLRANDCWGAPCKLYAQGWLADKWTYQWDGNVDFAIQDKKFHFSYDVAGERVVAFGSGRLHYWNGAGGWWSPEANNPTPPGEAFEHTFMAYDVARDRAVLIGHDQQEQDESRKWRQFDFAGSSWQEREPLGPGGFESSIANGLDMVYARDRGALVLVHPGGLSMWSGAKARPHVVASFDLSSPEQVLPALSDPVRRQVTSIGVAVSAGGTAHTFGSGEADGQASPGYQVYLHGQSSAGSTLLGELAGAVPGSPQLWSDSFHGDWVDYQGGYPTPALDNWLGNDQRLELLLTTADAQGASASPATIEVDYVELRVVYSRGPIGQAGADCHDDQGYWKSSNPCDDGDPATLYSHCRGGQCVGFTPEP